MMYAHNIRISNLSFYDLQHSANVIYLLKSCKLGDIEFNQFILELIRS